MKPGHRGSQRADQHLRAHRNDRSLRKNGSEIRADLARRRYWNPVAFRHNVAVSELPLRASRRPIGG